MTGSGTAADPYIIYDVNDLQAMENDLTAYYELANDIDASATVGWNGGLGFIPLGGSDSPLRPEPDGDILSAGTWTLFPAGGTFASKVQTDDGDASYIMGESNDCEVVFTVPISVPATASNILVRIYFISKNVASGTTKFRGLVRIGGVNYESSEMSRDNTWWASTGTALWQTNPATSLPWTADEVNGIGANSVEGWGVKVTDASPDIRFTHIYVSMAYEDPFTGHFDGKEFAITSLFMDRSGLGSWGIGGLFKANAGTLTGVALENCNITAVHAGGLVYLNEGIITNCHVTGTVEGSNAGGFVYTNEGTISECYSNCDVTGAHATYGRAGGFHIYNDGTISKCYSLGTVSATPGTSARAGGFSVENYRGTISDCYSRCSVTSEKEVGGFINANYSTIENCYSTGAVLGTDTGGFCRKNYDTITNCFWDTETSNQAASDGGTGKTTVEMETEATFTDAGWDFTTPIWYINTTINDGYPAFIGVVRRIKGNPNIDQRMFQHVERMD